MRLVPYIVAVLFLFCRNSLADVQTGMPNEISINVGLNETKTITLDDRLNKYEIVGTNDGVLTIDSGSNKTLLLKSISGSGAIQVRGRLLAELEVANVSGSNLYVAVNSIERFIAHSDALSLDRLEVEANEANLFIIDSNGRVSDLTLKIRNSSNVVRLSEIFVTTLKIEGSEFGDSPTKFDTCEIVLPRGWHPERLEISNMSANELRISESKRKSGVASFDAYEAASTALRIRNLTIRGQGAFIDLNELTNTSIDVRQVEFKRGGNFVIQHSAASAIPGTLVMDRVTDANSLHLGYPHGIEELILANVRSRYMVIDLPIERVDDIRRVKIAGLELTQGLDGSSATLIELAKKNTPAHPWDKRALFDTIRTVGFHRNSDGSVESPGCRALEARQLSELRERGYLAVLIGYTLWLLTGFGCSLHVPIATGMFLILLFGMYYALKLDHLSCLSRLKQGFQASVLFAITFGLPSEETIRSRLEGPTSASARSASRTEILFARFQGLLSLMQLTLLSIYFGQTTFG